MASGLSIEALSDLSELTAMTPPRLGTAGRRADRPGTADTVADLISADLYATTFTLDNHTVVVTVDGFPPTDAEIGRAEMAATPSATG